MNILISCIGKRGYLATYFRASLCGTGKIIGTSNTEWTPGFAACDHSELLPDICCPDYIDSVLRLCKKHNIQVILSVFDPDITRLSFFSKKFEDEGILLMHPADKTVQIANDKMLTYKHLSAIDYSVPETTDQLDKAIEMLALVVLEFPLVVKPRCGFGSQNVRIVGDHNTLSDVFGATKDALIQQFVKGPEYNIDGLGDLNGAPLSVIPWRKLQSRMGETERAVVVRDNDLIRIGKRLINDLKIVGPFNVDLVRDSLGNWSILELNMRFGGGYPVCHFAGADYPSKIVRLARGEQLKWDENFRDGATMMKALEPIPGPVSDYTD